MKFSATYINLVFKWFMLATSGPLSKRGRTPYSCQRLPVCVPGATLSLSSKCPLSSLSVPGPPISNSSSSSSRHLCTVHVTYQAHVHAHSVFTIQPPMTLKGWWLPLCTWESWALKASEWCALLIPKQSETSLSFLSCHSSLCSHSHQHSPKILRGSAFIVVVVWRRMPSRGPYIWILLTRGWHYLKG